MITPINNIIFKQPVFKANRTEEYNLAFAVSEDKFIPSNNKTDFYEKIETELKNLEGIHCPRCAQKMMSRDKYKNILENISQVKNGQELQKIIEENKSYLTDGTKFLLKDLESINAQYPDADINTVINKIHKHAPQFYKKSGENNIKLLKLVIEKLHLSNKDQENFKTTILKIQSHLNNDKYEFNEFKYIMTSSLRNSDYERKWKLYDKIIKNQFRAYDYLMNISKRNLPAMETSEALNNIGRVAFGRSVSMLNEISKNEENEKLTNKILLCSHCSGTTEKNNRYFKTSDNPDLLKSNFIQYLHDLNNAIDKEEISLDKKYLTSLSKHIYHASFKKIAMNSSDISFLEYKKTYKNMPFEYEEDIPCPNCGALMQSHEQLDQLYKQINETESIIDFAKIIKENEKYLPPVTKKLADKFRDCVIRDPYITEPLLKKQMAGFVKTITRAEFGKFMGKINKKLHNHSYSKEDKLKLQNLKNQLKDYEKKIKFFYMNPKLKNIIINSEIIIPNDIFNLENDADELLVNIELLNSPVVQSYSDKDINESWSKVFTSRLFKKTVFTKDHMIARISGGTDALDNKIGLHRECNQLKGKKTFPLWFKSDKNIPENTAKYLRKIDELSNQKNLKNCKDYSKNIADKIFYLTGNNKLKQEFSG